MNLMSYFLLKVLRLSNKDKQWLLGIVSEFWSETAKPINVCVGKGVFFGKCLKIEGGICQEERWDLIIEFTNFI